MTRILRSTFVGLCLLSSNIFAAPEVAVAVGAKIYAAYLATTKAVLELTAAQKAGLAYCVAKNPDRFMQQLVTALLANKLALILQTEADQLVNQQMLIDFENVSAQQYAAMSKLTTKEWKQIIESIFEELRVQAVHSGQNIGTIPQTLSEYFPMAQEHFMRLWAGYTFPNFQEAIKSFAHHDEIMVHLDKQIKSDPELKTKLAQASIKAYQLRNPVMGKFYSSYADFDIATYISQEAGNAKQRMLNAWVHGQVSLCNEQFSPHNVTKLQQECSDFEASLAESGAQSDKDLRTHALQVHTNLSKACNTQEIKQHSWDMSRDGLRTGLALLGEPVPGTQSFCAVDHAHVGDFVGRPGLYAFYARAIGNLDNAGHLFNKAKTIQDPLNRACVEQCARHCAQEAERACKHIKNGSLAQAFQAFKNSTDYKNQGQAIVDGTFNYSHVFSQQSMREFSRHLDQQQLAYEKLPVVLEHAKTCPESCSNRLLHHQQRMFKQQGMSNNELNLAVKELLANGHTFGMNARQLTAAEQQFLIRNKVSPADYTVVGNVVSQALHDQAIVIVQKATALQAQYPTHLTVSRTANGVAHLTQQALSACKRGDIVYSSDLLRMSNLLLDMSSTCALLPEHTQLPSFAGMISQGLEHDLRVAKALAQGLLVEGPIATVASLTHLASVECALGTLEMMVNIGDALALWDNGNFDLLSLSAEQRDGLLKAQAELVTQSMNGLSAGIQKLSSHIASMTPEERANAIGSQVSQVVIFDGCCNILGASAQVAKTGITKLQNAVPLIKAEAQQVVATAYGKALTAYEQAIAAQEATIFDVIKLAEASGIKIDMPFQHFNEQFMHKMEAEVAKNGAKKAVVGAEQGAISGTESSLAGSVAKHVPQNVDVAQALKNIPQTCAGFDKSIENISKLEKAIEAFKDLPGAQSKDSPLTKLIQNGKMGAESGHLTTARGAAYELEVAYDAMRRGEIVEGFGLKFKNAYSTKEFDVITNSRWYECKNKDWMLCTEKEIQDTISVLSQQAKIAQDHGKQFVFCSKKIMPDFMKQILNEKNIMFFEGII